jgi:ribosome-binding protein aMBF1 (putative translation factor)
MTRYEDVAALRRAKLSPKGRRQLRQFEQAATLAAQVMEFRTKNGLTQGELADRSGVSQADISRIERGSANPTEKTLCKIADALDADLCLVPRHSVNAL